MILKRWTEKLGMERDLLSSLPIWIRFPNFSLRFWFQKIISKTASLIDKPLYMDKATASGERLAFAKCFVKTVASSPRPNKILTRLRRERWRNLRLNMNGCLPCVTNVHVLAILLLNAPLFRYENLLTMVQRIKLLLNLSKLQQQIKARVQLMTLREQLMEIQLVMILGRLHNQTMRHTHIGMRRL